MSARLLIVAGLVLLALSQPAAQQAPVFTARTSGVRLHVGVTDRGRPVTGLTADHFVVLDNGVPQSIDAAGAVDRLAVAFAVDQSESTAVGPFGELQTAALLAFDALAPDDTAALLLFSDRLNLRVLPTSDRAAIRRPLEEAASHPRSLTALWDASLAAAGLLANERGRPVLMVVTDGCDNASWLSVPRAVAWLGRSDVTVDYLWYGVTYGITRGRSDSPPPYWDGGDNCLGPQYLDKAAEATGGQMLQTDRSDLARRIRERVSNLRSGYLLTYTPSGVKAGKDGWHKIEVRLRNGARGRATTRPGYFADGAP